MFVWEGCVMNKKMSSLQKQPSFFAPSLSTWVTDWILPCPLFDVANQSHCYIDNSLRTWEYPIGDPVQFLNWCLAWKWGWVLLWPEVIFFSSVLWALLTRLRREISIRKKYPLEPRVMQLMTWNTSIWPLKLAFLLCVQFPAFFSALLPWWVNTSSLFLLMLNNNGITQMPNYWWTHYDHFLDIVSYYGNGMTC